MVEQSIALMTIIDIAIIGSFAYAFRIFQKHKKLVIERKMRSSMFLITLGMGSIAVFYLSDLITMFVLPYFMPMQDSMTLMNSLHDNLEWFILPVGIIIIVSGFCLGVLQASRVAGLLQENEGHFQQKNDEAVTARTKLERT